MSKDLVLITGATGHVGFGTLAFLLDHGYRARIVHRLPDHVKTLKLTATIQRQIEDVEFALIPDLYAPDAFREAMKGVSGVIHVASPIPLKLGDDTDWQRLFYDPAEKGTWNILSTAANERKIQRFIITSTCGVTTYASPGRTGPQCIIPRPDAETAKAANNAYSAYQYAKALAYYTALDFVETQRPQFDVVHLLLGYVQGANELYTTPEDLTTRDRAGSNWGVMMTALGLNAAVPRFTAQVHLHDVAKAHVLSLSPDLDLAKSGKTFILAANGGDGLSWKDFVPVIREHFPKQVEQGVLCPEARNEEIITHFDVENAEAAFGKFLGVEEMVQSVVGQYVELVEGSGRDRACSTDSSLY